MSYCRFGPESDVYVYEGEDGYNCCGCKLDRLGFVTTDPDEMIDHLEHHKEAGHKVPKRALWALADDAIGWESGKGDSETMIATVFVEGRPKPAQRPRLGRRRKAYTPTATLEAEDRIAHAFGTRYGCTTIDPLFPKGTPLRLTVDYSNHGELIRLEPLDAPMPTMLGDVDNYLKTTMDGLQKAGAFDNDKQIVEVWARKHPNDADLEKIEVTWPQ